MNRLASLWSRPGGALLLLLLGALAYWGGEHLRRDLWEPDEARFAYVAKEMAADGRWLVPHRHGEPYAHKPPLMFWLINAAATLTGTGVNAVTTRAPSLLGGVASLWSVVMLLRLWGRADLDLAAALVCASTYLFWKQGAWGQIDMLLLGCQMLALLALFAQDRDRSRRKALAAYACMGLAVLAKGPVGFLVPFGAYLAAKLAAGERADLRRGHLAWGPLVTLAFPALWIGLVALNDPPAGYLEELLWKQNVDRAQGELGHQKPPYYFLMYFPMDGLPWTLLLPFAWMALGAGEDDRRFRRRLAGWMLFVILLFSLIASKRNLYILLCYPAAAMLVAAGWSGLARSPPARRVTAFLRALPVAVGIGALVAGLVHPWIPSPLPLHLRPLLAAGMVILAAAAGLRGGGTGPHRAALLWLVTFSSAGALILPCFNEHKTPAEIRALAAEHLGADEPLFLYQINGEIQALYAGARGRRVDSAEELRALLDSRPHGFVIAEKRKRPAADADPVPLPPALLPRLRTGEFRMGGKTMVWGEWGERPAPR